MAKILLVEDNEMNRDVMFRLLPEGDHLVSVGAHAEDHEERLGVTWERSGFDTVAGLLMARLGRVPVPHEVVDVDGVSMVVLKMDGARVLQVLVKAPGPA
jgi:CBS domain containing-hemolysin-like protein